jgi:hypothetical protein
VLFRDGTEEQFAVDSAVLGKFAVDAIAKTRPEPRSARLECISCGSFVCTGSLGCVKHLKQLRDWSLELDTKIELEVLKFIENSLSYML